MALKNLLQRCILLLVTYNAYAQTKVIISTPVNPPSEGAILSIQCQIWKLQTHHEVVFIRNLGYKSERLSSGEDIGNSMEDRYFLAVRPLADGSIVYFLTIIDVSRKDKGDYSCNIYGLVGTSLELVDTDEIHVDVSYFPDEIFPQCSMNISSTTIVYEGTWVKLKCASELGNPSVSIQWKRTRGRLISTDSTQVTDGDLAYNELTIQATIEDRQTIFLCEIDSSSFPDRPRSCHLGPLNIIPNPNRSAETTVKSFSSTNAVYIELQTTSTSLSCTKSCSLQDSPLVYWISATLGCLAVGLIFAILGISLFVRLRRISAIYRKPTTSRPDIVVRHHVDEDTYVDIQNGPRAFNECVYMPLKKSNGRNRLQMGMDKNGDKWYTERPPDMQ